MSKTRSQFGSAKGARAVLTACRRSPIFIVTMAFIGLCLGMSAGQLWRAKTHYNSPASSKLTSSRLTSSKSHAAPLQLAGFSTPKNHAHHDEHNGEAVSHDAAAHDEAAHDEAAHDEAAHEASSYDVARVERAARTRWAKANPVMARATVKAGSYQEVAHLVQKSDWDALSVQHRGMIRRLMLEARAGQVGVMPCFAPGSDLKTVRAFEGVNSELQFFRAGSYWSNTAAGGHVAGAPMTLRWSIVPDGTALPSGAGEAADPSNLKARLNTIYGNEATWRPLFRQIFARYATLSGITYIEENDDGVPITNTNANPGVAGVRGDVRIGGHNIDGNSGILAYNYFPNNGDMVIDTNDSFYGNTGGNSLGLRNVLAHEHGHGLAFAHVCPINQTKLMEPFISFAFDGPQADELQNVQRGYGDFNEPNDNQARGTDLGTLGNGTTSRTNLSIQNTADQDFYRFNASGAKRLSATVTPLGGSYLEGPQNPDGTCSTGTTFAAGAQRNLKLGVYDGAGNELATVDATGAGSSETLSEVLLNNGNGPFALRVVGDPVDKIQLYAFQITLTDAGPAASFATNGTPVVSDNTGNGNGNGLADPGETSINLSIPIINVGTLNATNVSATLVSLAGNVSVVQNNSAYPDLAQNTTGSNTTPFTISVAPGFTCGSNIPFRLDVQSDQGSSPVNFSLSTGSTVQQTFSYTGSAVAIPDGTGPNAPGAAVDVPITVSGSGMISDIDVVLNNVTHSFVGDLVMTLISPTGTRVAVVDRIGNINTRGPNFVNTVLDDAAGRTIQDATNADAPFTGSYRPASALSDFNGLNANGTWKLRVQDFYNGDTGSVNAYSLRISTVECGTPVANQPPVVDLNGDGTGIDNTITYTEGSALPFLAPAATVANDAGENLQRIILTITNVKDGSFESLSRNTSGTMITGSYNNATGVLDLFGPDSVANFEKVLRTIRYRDSSLNPNTTPRRIEVVAYDSFGQSQTAVATVNVVAVNNAPSVIVPTDNNTNQPIAQSTNQNTPLTLSGATGNKIGVVDLDDAGNVEEVTVSVQHGTLTLNGTTGLTFTQGDGTSDATMTFRGTVAPANGTSADGTANAALDGIVYTPDTNFTGPDTLTLSINDLGNTGTGGPLSATASLTINVQPVTPSATTGAIISEFRNHGALGSADEYIELYNTTGAPLNISGWSVQYIGESAAGLQTVTIPANTSVPARGHFLFTGSNYSLGSLATGNTTLSGEISDNSGLQLRNASGATVDAVAFVGSTLGGEGTRIAAAPSVNGEYAFVRDESSGTPKDTNDNAADFNFVSTNAAIYNGLQSQLGAPGPQNMSSPVFPITPLGVALFDTDKTANARPNQVRVGAQTGPNAPQGTILFRRQLTNNSGAPITRLRVRVVRLTTLNSPGYSDTTQADLRMLSSIGGPRASASQGGSVPVSNVTLEAPATEGSGANGGGGINSSALDTIVTMNAPLAVDEKRNYEFLFRVVRPGNFNYALNIEVLPAQ